MNLAVADFTVVSADASADPGVRSVPAGEAVSLRRNMLVDLDVVPYGSVPRPTKGGDA